MTAHLGKAELLRMRRQGMLPLSLELGLELLDAALLRPEAVLDPSASGCGVMQRQLGGAEVPALYRALLRGGLQRASAVSADTSALRARLAALASDAERLQALVELVQEDIAAVLALPGASSVPADVPLKELGLDSLMAVELRNRLSARVGSKLPTTLAFDYPTPRAIAQLLVEKLELGRSLARVERRRAVDAAMASEAIAIVGMSCRAPRDLDEPGELLGAAGGWWRRRGPAAEALEPGVVAPAGAGHREASHRKAASSTRWRSSTPGSSASRRGRRWRWTRSSGCCWRGCGRRSSVPGSTGGAEERVAPACLSALPAATMARARSRR